MHRRDRVWEKLDRLFFNTPWLVQIPDGSVKVLSNATSDHSSLLYKLSLPSQPVTRSSKFQNMRLKRPDFMEVVSRSWLEPIEGYRMLRFSLKLRRLKAALC